MPLLCPFECGVVLKTQTDQRQHLMKEHSCTDKEKNDFFDEREAEEKNNIRKTYLSNTQGLTLYKFRKLLRENNLHEVSYVEMDTVFYLVSSLHWLNMV